MRPFRPPSVFGLNDSSNSNSEKEAAVSEMVQLPKDLFADLFPQPVKEEPLEEKMVSGQNQEDEKQSGILCRSQYFSKVQELVGSNSNLCIEQTEQQSSIQFSIGKDSEEEDTYSNQNPAQNVLIWTRLANGNLQLDLPPPQSLQLLDFYQILIAKNNLPKLASYRWIQGAQERVNFYLNKETNLSTSDLHTLQQVKLIFKQNMQNFQYYNVKQEIEETLDTLFQTMKSQDYQKLGEKVYHTASSLNDSSADCIAHVIKDGLETSWWKQKIESSFQNLQTKAGMPDVQFLNANLELIRKEFESFKQTNCQQQNYSPLYGLCYIFEVSLQQLEDNTKNDFADKSIELCVLQFLSMFFGMIRGFHLSENMTKLSYTWKEYQMKYLVNVAENPDIAFLKQKSWEDCCRNLSFPWSKNRRPDSGSRNAHLKEVAKKNIKRENLYERISNRVSGITLTSKNSSS